jgi:dipeptidyl aminopeptidase/acylaminoacyl peptidase
VAPFFSPDGRSVGYYDFAESRLEWVPLDGGSPTVIAETMPSTGGSFWAEDRMILHADLAGSLYEIPAGGGEPRVIATVDAENGEGRFIGPRAHAGTSTVVVGITLPQERGQIVAIDRETGERRDLVSGEAPIGFTAAGHLVFKRGGAVTVQPMKPGTLEPFGSSITLIENVSDDVALSLDGTLVYRLGASGDLRPGRFVWIDRDGNVTPALDEVLVYPRYPRISPDGRQVAFTAGPGGEGKIWVYDLKKERPSYNVTFEDHNIFPIWSPDGRELAYWPTTARRPWASAGSSGSPRTAARWNRRWWTVPRGPTSPQAGRRRTT